MTLAELKRKLDVGVNLTMVYHHWNESDRVHKLLNVTRPIVKKNTQGVWLELDGKKSFLDFPSHASLVEANDKGFSMYEAGYRPLTAEEQAIKDNEPKDDKQSELDMMTDGSTMFYRRRAYYKEHNAEYLQGLEQQRGLYFDFNRKLVRDCKIKGLKLLEYAFS